MSTVYVSQIDRNTNEPVHITSSMINTSLLYVQSTSVSNDQAFYQQDAFSERLQCSRVSEPVTSLSDVASTDIESSDTATESPE